MRLRNKHDRYDIDEEDIIMDKGLQSPTDIKDDGYGIRVKCGNYCLPPELTDDIVGLMEDYAKHQSEKYAKHYFNTRTKLKHPLGIHEYDLWNKLNNKEI